MGTRQAQRILLCLITIAAALPTAAQFTYSTHSARSGAMGGVHLPDHDRRSITLGYRQGYLLAGMADKYLQIVWPTVKTGTFTANYQHHGNLDFHEQQFEAGYTLRVSEWLHAAVSARYLHLGTSDGHYPSQHWLGASVMLHGDLGPTQVVLMAHTRPWDSERQFGLHLTATYRPSVHLLTAVEVESEERTRVRMGMEYCYEERWFVRTGIASHPMIFTFGLGLKPANYTIDLGVEVHSSLGITPHTSITLWL